MALKKTMATPPMKPSTHLPFPYPPCNYSLTMHLAMASALQITTPVSSTMTLMMNMMHMELPTPMLNTTMAIPAPMATTTAWATTLPLNHQVYMVIAP